jgi:hypothetical protein
MSATRDPLPTEARVGAAVPFAAAGNIGVNVYGDAIARLNESSFAIAAGIEAGLLPHAADEIGAVARIGYDAESNQLGALRLGAGITVRSVSLDYAFQNLKLVGGVHRLGVRWTVR